MLSLVVASSHDVAAARERAEFGCRMQLRRSRAYREKIHSFKFSSQKQTRTGGGSSHVYGSNYVLVVFSFHELMGQ